MKTNRTITRRTGEKKSTRHHSHSAAVSAIDHAVVLIDTACVVAGAEDLTEFASDRQKRLRNAIAKHDTELIFDTLMTTFSLQGISDHAAYTYMAQHGSVTWGQIEVALAARASCPKLQSYWQLYGCGYE